MRGFVFRLLITALGLWVADRLLHGLRFDSDTSLLVAALLLGLVNAFVRPVVFILTLPLTLMTLGLFLFVVNGAMVLFVARIMPSFHLDGLGTAVLTAVIVGIIGWIANGYVGNRGRLEVWNVRG